MRDELAVFVLLALAACAPAPSSSAPPVARVTLTAAEAWPQRSTEPPPLSALEYAQAVAIRQTCDDPGATTAQEWAYDFGLEAVNASYFEVRAIPGGNGARWSWWARAAIAAHGDCAAIDKLRTALPPSMSCEEVGCTRDDGRTATTTCAGDVATWSDGSAIVVRDCTEAFARCDPASPTACTDRHPVACDPALADRCDHDVKLGCDHTGRVSFGDCARIGARCVENDTGAACVSPAPRCDDFRDTTCADGKTLRACLLGAFVDVDCAALGFAGCADAHCTR